MTDDPQRVVGDLDGRAACFGCLVFVGFVGLFAVVVFFLGRSQGWW